MRWLIFAMLAACSELTPTSLDGPITCGAATCGSGQICVSQESGSQCDVDPANGIGQYQEFGWTCAELPADCDGVTRDCFPGQLEIVSDDGRYVVEECI